MNVVPASGHAVELALASDFRDFEDALHDTALTNEIPILVTRNVKDDRQATLGIRTPAGFLAGRTRSG